MPSCFYYTSFTCSCNFYLVRVRHLEQLLGYVRLWRNFTKCGKAKLFFGGLEFHLFSSACVLQFNNELVIYLSRKFLFSSAIRV